MDFEYGINKLYDKVGYFDKYGTHFLMFAFIIFIWFCLLTYFQMKPNIESIKNDWANKKCDIKIMPIAGFINPPPGVSAFKATKDNFNACMFNMLGGTVSKAVGPAYEAGGGILGVFSMFFVFLNTIRNMLNYIRTKIFAIYYEILAKVNSLAQPLKNFGYALRGLLMKLRAIFIVMLYKLIIMYYSIIAFAGTMIEGLTGGLFVGATVIIGLAAWFPWTLVIVIPLFIIYVIYAILSIIINTGVAAVIRGVKGDKVPNYLF